MYNKTAMAMIRYAKRKCDTCEYGEWSKTWKRARVVTSRSGRVENKFVTFLRARTCKVCKLRDTQTEYISYWRMAGENEWRTASEHDSEIHAKGIDKIWEVSS